MSVRYPSDGPVFTVETAAPDLHGRRLRELGRRLRALRNARGLTQAEASDRAGLSRNPLYRASLVDTNILVYRFDPRFPRKQRLAQDLLRAGLVNDDLVLPHQAIVEFVSVVTRPRPSLGGRPLLPPDQACSEAELLAAEFVVVYPDREVLLTALRGVAAYRLSWFDAHLWAHAEVHGVAEILSEDFQHGRHYGSVRVVDPFLAAEDAVYELPPLYGA